MVKTCIIIVGPTCIGKTSLAVRLAQQFSTEIISADSRQCFKELNIGVAKPSATELSLIRHHFINSHSVTDNVNAALFEKFALDSVQKIFLGNDMAIMVGGTGLYIKTFCDGIDEVPAISPALREEIVTEYDRKGLEWLKSIVQQNDPSYFVKGEIQNPHRLMRALEIKLSTGKSILEFQTRLKKRRDFNIIKVGLELPREDLYERINDRVDGMILQGLLEEVKSLESYKHLNALQTVGYRELFDYFDNKISLSEAIDFIKTNTRKYAKRQITWFKKDAEINWCAPGFEGAMAHIKSAG